MNYIVVVPIIFYLSNKWRDGLIFEVQ